MKFLRNFGLGILWAALFPLLCVVIALIAVYGVFTFIVEFVIMLIHFFQGKSLFPSFPEDEQAFAIRQAAYANAAEPKEPTPPTQQVANNNSTTIIQQNYYNGHNPYPPQNPYSNPYYGQPRVPYNTPQQPSIGTPSHPVIENQGDPIQIESKSKEGPNLLSFPSSDESEKDQ